jgi:hypothetical protein
MRKPATYQHQQLLMQEVRRPVTHQQQHSQAGAAVQPPLQLQGRQLRALHRVMVLLRLLWLVAQV